MQLILLQLYTKILQILLELEYLTIPMLFSKEINFMMNDDLPTFELEF
jgi:hypothetical protein